jgi:hypothetical protein
MNDPMIELESLVSRHLADLDSQRYPTGRVLFSSRSTLTKGDVYFLGLNPGGPREHLNEDVGFWPLLEDCRRIADKSAGWTAFKDEPWGGKGKFIQRQVSWLFKELGYPLPSVPASNLIFVRTESAPSPKDFYSLADCCWPIHEFLLDLIQPKLIVTHGCGQLSTYGYLKTRVAGEGAPEISFPSGHGKWPCRSFCWRRGGKHIQVVAVPHLSRYCIEGKPQVIHQIRSLLSRAPSSS